jgi:hypothetical protein
MFYVLSLVLNLDAKIQCFFIFGRRLTRINTDFFYTSGEIINFASKMMIWRQGDMETRSTGHYSKCRPLSIEHMS